MSQGAGDTRESVVPQGGGLESSDGMNQGMRVLSYLIAGVAVYGLVGWFADRLLGTSFLLPIGIVLGAGLGIYLIIARFGQVSDNRTGSAAQVGARSGQSTSDTTEGTT